MINLDHKSIMLKIIYKKIKNKQKDFLLYVLINFILHNKKNNYKKLINYFKM